MKLLNFTGKLPIFVNGLRSILVYSFGQTSLNIELNGLVNSVWTHYQTHIEF